MRNAFFTLLLLPGIINILAEENPTSVVDNIAKGRVLNGKPVNPPHSRPYVAQLWILENGNTSKRLVHGIIYDEYTIITQGTYIEEKLPVYIVAGKYYSDDLKLEDSQQNRNICSVSKYNGPGSVDIENYYAAIHLSEPLVFNEFVQPINFAPPGAKYPKTTCSLIGWGGTRAGGPETPTDVLREAVVSPKPLTMCGYKEDDPRMCCIEEGGCYNDFGAPVVCDLNGVPTAYAYIVYSDFNCRDGFGPWLPEMPRDWLLDEMEKAKTKCSSVRPKPTPSPTPPPPPPPTSPPGPPPTPPPPPSGECECRLKGYCKMYFECVNYPNNTAGWEYRGNCTGNLYWNSNDVTGGFCDYFQNLPPELQAKYRSDPTCIHCDWFQELSDVCSPRYTFRDTNLVEHKMSCPASPSGKDPLYWQLNTKSCDLCYNAVDYHGVACQCKK